MLLCWFDVFERSCGRVQLWRVKEKEEMKEREVPSSTNAGLDVSVAQATPQ